MEKENKGGAFQIARSLFDSEIWLKKPATWKILWIYFLGKASFSDTKSIKRGELFFSPTRDISDVGCDLTPDKIKKCMSWLTKTKMISTSRSTRGVYVKVLRYEEYQNLDSYKKNKTESEAPRKETFFEKNEILSTDKSTRETEKKEPRIKKKTTKDKNTSTDKSTKEALEKHQRSTTIYNNDKNDKNDKKPAPAQPARLSPERAKMNEEVLMIYDLFYKTVNPTINYGNKTTRKACEELITKYGFEKVEAMATFAIAEQGQKFCPTITTPYQLKEKLGALIIYKQRKSESGIGSL